MKVKQIYNSYMVPKNLQEHMLRTGALAQIIMENWKSENIDSDSIFKTCLFHDIAKPINFDLTKQAQFGMSEADIRNLEILQNRIKKDYGNDEHNATVKICEEIGLSPNSIKFVNNLEWKYIPRLIQENDIESLIPIYCDMRIGPKNILSLNMRLSDLRERTSADEYNENVKNGNILEEMLKLKLKIDINSILEEQLTTRFEKLLEIEIN